MVPDQASEPRGPDGDSRSINEALSERATLFLEPRIIDVLKHIYGCRPIPLALNHNGQTLNAFHVKRPGTDRVCLGPFNFQCVLPNRNAEIVRQILGLARGLGESTTARIKLHHRLAPDLVEEFGLEYATEAVETLIPLDGGADAVMSRMRSRHRSKVRAARRHAEAEDLSIRAFDDACRIKEFYKIMLAAYRDKHRMLPQPEALFLQLFGRFSDKRSVHAYGAFRNRTGEMLGATIMLADETQWCYGWGAAKPGLDKLEVGTILIDHMIGEAISAGAKIFSLGNSSVSQTGLRQFKRGWGGEDHDVVTYCSKETPSPVDLGSDYPLARRLISLMPLSVIRHLSPLAVRVLV